MKRVGVLRKAVDFKVPLGGGAYFNPFGRGGRQGDKPLPMRVQSATRPSRTASQMSQDLESSLQAQQSLETHRQERLGLMGQEPDADARDKEMNRLRSIVEELAPRDQRERYMAEAMERGLMSRRNPRVIPNELAYQNVHKRNCQLTPLPAPPKSFQGLNDFYQLPLFPNQNEKVIFVKAELSNQRKSLPEIMSFLSSF